MELESRGRAGIKVSSLKMSTNNLNEIALNMEKLYSFSIEEAINIIIEYKLYHLNYKEAKVCSLLTKRCKNLSEVSACMHLSPKTIEDYSKRIRLKTMTDSIVQAVAKVNVGIVYLHLSKLNDLKH